MFRFASPVEVLVATSVYCSDYYGSLAGWDLGSDKANMFFNAWSTHVKLTWRVPRQTRTFLVQSVLAPGFTSARTEVLARYVTFFRSLRTAPSHEVRTAALLAARDLQTVTGRNLALVAELSGLDPWTASSARVREALRERCWRLTTGAVIISTNCLSITRKPSTIEIGTKKWKHLN